VGHKKKQDVTCGACGFAVCTKCQRAYDKPRCMQCGVLLPRTVARCTLGREYYVTKYRPHMLVDILMRERQMLPLVQPYVDWEKTRRAAAAKRRFGIFDTVPPAPAIPEASLFTDEAVRCPKGNCQGFVVSGRCGICKAAVCPSCREVRGGEEHTCDSATVQSLLLVHTESKACPRCRVRILRSSGCTHMCCTACGTHFDWATGATLRHSTNQHYVGAVPLVSARGEELCDLDSSDLIPQDVFDSANQALVRLLYDERRQVAYLKNQSYDEARIVSKAKRQLQQLRVRFLMGELHEKDWMEGIGRAYDGMDASMGYASVLQLYLAATKMFQRTVHRHEEKDEDVIEQLTRLFAVLRQAIDDLRKEHGSGTLTIRGDAMGSAQPVFGA
jgi:hypothetical protein